MYVRFYTDFVVLLAVICLEVFCVFVHKSEAHDDIISMRGSVNERLTLFSEHKETLLNPRQELTNLPAWTNRLYSDLTAKFFFQQCDAVVGLRPVFDISENDTKSKIFIDNAYLNYRLTEQLFFTIGKQNMVEGAALHFNPTDFLGEGKRVDALLTEEERKQQREGSYFVRLEHLYHSGALSFLIAPDFGYKQSQATRGLLKISKQFDSADSSLLVLVTKDRPGMGFNYSSTHGESIELHAEISMRKGSHRGFIKKGAEVSAGSGVFYYEIIDPEDRNKFFAQIVVGGHYTSPDKINVIFEYFYNHDGYKRSEWQSFVNAVRENSGLLLSSSGGMRNILLNNLSLANALMTFRTLRQHYGFFRINTPELLRKIEGTLSALVNLNDSSFTMNPRFEYKLEKGFSAIAGVLLFNGGGTTEFGLTPMKSQWYFQIRKSF
jgi:hypothetical protein